MAQYEQNAQSFGDDYTNGDYTVDESQMMAEGDPSAPPMSPDGASANQPGSPHGQGFQDEDEEEIDVEAGEYEDEDDEDYLKDAEYEYEVGGLNCLWKPDRPSSFREFTGRCGTWLALNREQIASGITGKSKSSRCLFLNVLISQSKHNKLTILLLLSILFYALSWRHSDPRGCLCCPHGRHQPHPCSPGHLDHERHHRRLRWPPRYGFRHHRLRRPCPSQGC